MVKKLLAFYDSTAADEAAVTGEGFLWDLRVFLCVSLISLTVEKLLVGFFSAKRQALAFIFLRLVLIVSLSNCLNSGWDFILDIQMKLQPIRISRSRNRYNNNVSIDNRFNWMHCPLSQDYWPDQAQAQKSEGLWMNLFLLWPLSTLLVIISSM